MSSFSKKKKKLEEGRDSATEPQNLRVTADLLILQKRSAIVIRLPK